MLNLRGLFANVRFRKTRSEFLGAYWNEDLIGFLKMVYVDDMGVKADCERRVVGVCSLASR
jgi:hypothetical protein